MGLGGLLVWLWAHPRVSGENADTTLYGSWVDGSSPRERGKLHCEELAGHRGRLIPA